MSMIVTTRMNSLPADADADEDEDEDAIVPTLQPLGARRGAYGATPVHRPVIGAVALDAIAAIAGPARTPDYERAWSAAFAIVMGRCLADAADRELAAVA
jgi:hemoglobin-like flavoprotein